MRLENTFDAEVRIVTSCAAALNEACHERSVRSAAA